MQQVSVKIYFNSYIPNTFTKAEASERNTSIVLKNIEQHQELIFKTNNDS